MKFTKQELESEALIREELRIEDLSKRIQEQNEYAAPRVHILGSQEPGANSAAVNCLKSSSSSMTVSMCPRLHDTT